MQTIHFPLSDRIRALSTNISLMYNAFRNMLQTTLNIQTQTKRNYYLEPIQLDLFPFLRSVAVSDLWFLTSIRYSRINNTMRVFTIPNNTHGAFIYESLGVFCFINTIKWYAPNSTVWRLNPVQIAMMKMTETKR